MPSDQIKHDPDGMKGVGSNFRNGSQLVKETTDMLKKNWEPLDGGQQWLGQAATKAKREMVTVFKELKSLQEALDESEKGVKDISQEFENCDNEVSSFWKQLAAALSGR